jgi:hypothetical protein
LARARTAHVTVGLAGERARPVACATDAASRVACHRAVAVSGAAASAIRFTRDVAVGSAGAVEVTVAARGAIEIARRLTFAAYVAGSVNGAIGGAIGLSLATQIAIGALTRQVAVGALVARENARAVFFAGLVADLANTSFTRRLVAARDEANTKDGQ